MFQSKDKFPKPGHRSVGRGKRLAIVYSCVVICGVLVSGFDQLKSEKDQSPEDLSNSAESLNPVDVYSGRISNEALRALSLELENEAKAQMKLGNYEAASAQYQKASKLQKDLNDNYPSSQYHDVGRVLRLQLESRNAIAEPLFVESLDFEQQAKSFASTGDIDSAVEALNRAIAIQQRLNDEHHDSRQASVLRLRQLTDWLVDLKTDELYSQILDFSERADSLKSLGKLEMAAEFYRKAALLQEQLNADFPGSSHASSLHAVEFRKQQKIAQSAPLVLEIEEKSGQLDQLLAMRNMVEALPLLEELKQAFQDFKKAFPLNPLSGRQLEAKIVYLYSKKAELPTIQDQVYRALLPVPEVDGIRMLRTEVPQSLYVQLMNSNPSRNPADLNPVDSVSWVDAVAFCERLSWILGKEVRLPTESEFRKALQGFNPSDASDLIWSILDAKGVSQTVAEKKPFPSGHFDLLGNLGEWLTSEHDAASKTAFYAGGHVLDSLEEIVEIPVHEMRKVERSRLLGFRVVLFN